MVPVAISGKLHGSSVCTPNPEVIVNLGRKRVKNYSFGRPTVAFMGMLVLGFACCELSEELALVSVPLGFRIFGYDKGTTWISQNGVFALGFIGDYGVEDNGFVVGIWYNLPKIEIRVPVWVVGGGIRVSQNSTLELSLDGSLVLIDGTRHALPIWSSNTDNIGVKTATLVNNGNLVLMGTGGRIIWESFSSPTDTLLPGQSLSFPQSLQACSLNSIASYYSFEMKRSGEIALVWENNVTYWSSHLSHPVVVGEVRLEEDGRLGLFDANGDLAWFRYSEDYRDPSVSFRRLRIDADGNLRIYSWYNVSSSWKVVWQAVQGQCHVFGSCGLYSICGYNSSGPSCECLLQNSATGDCDRIADLGNCNTGFSMLVLKQTFLYSLYPPHDVDIMLGVEDCKRYCLNDTTCFAVTAKNDGSGLCTVKRTSFISGYHYSSVPATSFLKVCLVPEAVSAQATYLHGNTLSLEGKERVDEILGHKRFMVAVVLLLLVTACVFLTMEIIIFWFVLHRRQRNSFQMGAAFGKSLGMNPHYNAMIRLSLEEVKELTKNFGFKLAPNLYRGMLPNKMPVAVKVLGDIAVSEKDFMLLVSTLGGTHHRNLVSLKGFCYEPQHKLLLYEYIKNGSLDQWLFNAKQCRSRHGWHLRLNISIGIARALAYLHLECKQCIPHGNLKLKNVLLDENMVAKVNSYGLHSLLLEGVASSSETLLEKDVYMLGLILLQIFSGNRSMADHKLHDLAYHKCKSGKLFQFVDPFLPSEEVQLEGMERIIRLALWCMQSKPSTRPSIGEVVMVLEGALSVDMPPEHDELTL